MGQTLGEPITAKETSSCANSTYKVGSSCMQGWRVDMEDAHTHLLSLPNDSDAAFFAVYDGHGGAKVSQYASMHLHKKIVNNHFYDGDIESALKKGFLDLDLQMLADDEMKQEMSGTTAVIVLIKNKTIYCGNVGDSRAVASVNGRAVPLSNDHKPCNEEESRRINAAGGWVEFNRVNGNLALSRALGDFTFKRNDDKSAEEQIVTAFPEVTKHELTSDFEFIVLACDGIWDVLSSQEVVDFCYYRLALGQEPESICEQLLDRCLAPDCELSGLGCDNMTVVLVVFLPMFKTTKEMAEAKASNADGKPKLSIAAATATTSDTRTSASDMVCDEQFSTPCHSPNSADQCADDEKPPSQFKVIETSDDDEDAFIQAASEVIAAEKSVSVDAPLPTVLPVANNASVMSSAVTETS